MKNPFRFLMADKPATRDRRERLQVDISNTAVYIIGDVHGCYEHLIALEQRIAHDAAGFAGDKLIVMLGDYIDRGPASSEVINHLLAAPPEGFRRICLAGNHEAAMLDYLEGRLSLAAWKPMGAAATLMSYGIDIEHMAAMYRSEDQLDSFIRSSVPESHIEFLRSLPIMIDAGRFVFVHAGIRPGTPLIEQTDEDLMFIRADFYNSPLPLSHWVVHGHTPIETPQLDGRRINIDTGAYYTGRLSALRLWKDKGRLLSTSPAT